MLLVVLVTTGCNTIGVFEKMESFPKHEWASAERLSFDFDIADTASFYNVYVVLRHTDAYHYNNIYLNITTVNPGDSAITRQHNFVLADNKRGWLGAAMDDVVEQRVAINSSPVKLKKGSYTVMLQQIMREDPLQNIINAGVRVEKVVQ